jgi:peroxiredoxin
MAIKVGDRVPNGSFTVMTGDGPKPMTTDELFKGKKVVLFAVPGAFTPTCHKNHLPGFVKNAAAIKAKGVNTIAVTGVNDVFVMDAWKKASGGDAIEFLADGSGNWAKALGLTADLTERGLGVRSQRYAMVVDDGVVKMLNVEDAPGKAEISGADNLLKSINTGHPLTGGGASQARWWGPAAAKLAQALPPRTPTLPSPFQGEGFSL